MQNTKAIVRNISTGDLYAHVEGNTFQNIRTGVQGTVTDEAARKTFIINVPMTEMVNEYPYLKVFINRLNLRCSNVNE